MDGQWLSAMFYLVVSWISGTVLNSFVVIIYIQDWRQRRSVVICDQITTIMSLINVLLQFTLTMDGMFLLFGLYPLLPKEFYLCVLIFIFFLIDVGFWHTTWLAISYFIRLVSVSHRFFVWLKSSFPSSAFPLLLGSSVGSFFINIPFLFTTHVTLQEFVTNKSYVAWYSPELHPSCILIHIVFGCCLPLIVTVICIGFSLKSILGHVWKMRQNSHQYSFSPQLQALLQAAKTMILRVLLELAFNIIMTGIISTSFTIPKSTSVTFWYLVMSFPTAQCVILIIGSHRIKSRLQRHREPSSL